MRVLLIFVLTIMIVQVTTAQNRSELEKQRSEIQREIEDVKRSLSQTKKNRKESLGQLALLQKKLRLREAAINNINQQINVIQGSISQSRNEISRLKKELDTLKMQYEKSVVYAYKNRSNYDFLNFIFSAASFNDALKRVEYLKSYRSYREQQSNNIKNTQALLQNKISTLELTRREQSEVLSKQQKEKMVLVEEKKEKDVVVSKLKSREKELSKELSAKQKADNKLRASIKAAIDREIRLARQKALEEENRKKAENPDVAARPATTPTTRKEDVARKRSVFDDVPGGEIVSDNFEKNRGKLPWPVDKGHIKIGYGTYSIPETKLKGNNPGLTLETEEGSSVKAVFDGDVISVFDVDGESNVIIRHGKYFSTYGRLSSTAVSKGQKVKAGQIVGRASSNEDGNGEIEFLLMEENRKLDPALWIKRR
jgi:septal ring factor EnvC (AmiA/AmiB activator)